MSISNNLDYKHHLDYKHPCPSSAPASSTEEIEIATPLPGKKFCGSRLIFLLPSPVFEGTSAHPGKILAFLSPKDIVRLVSASKEWYTGVFQDSRSLWNPSRYLAPMHRQTALPSIREAALLRIKNSLLAPYPEDLQSAFSASLRPIENLPKLSLRPIGQVGTFRGKQIRCGIHPEQMSHAVMRFTARNGLPGIVLHFQGRGEERETEGLYVLEQAPAPACVSPTGRAWRATYETFSGDGLTSFTSAPFALCPDDILTRLLRLQQPRFKLVETPPTEPLRRPSRQNNWIVPLALAVFAVLAIHLLSAKNPNSPPPI